ncbi:MAG: hypothetical protein KGO02_14515 [Alphaproteobacteria bacterium]|nr:hypothetical protein [Alphaproteobacteria bacterium]
MAHDFDHNGAAYLDTFVKVTSIEDMHFHLKPGPAAPRAGHRSYTYRFDMSGHSMVFTGKTRPSAAVTKLADGADVLTSEVIEGAARADYMRRTMHLKPAVEGRRVPCGN